MEDLERDLLSATGFRSVDLAHSSLTDQAANLVNSADYRSRSEAGLGCHRRRE